MELKDLNQVNKDHKVKEGGGTSEATKEVFRDLLGPLVTTTGSPIKELMDAPARAALSEYPISFFFIYLLYCALSFVFVLILLVASSFWLLGFHGNNGEVGWF